jgi:hypothetical protein
LTTVLLDNHLLSQQVQHTFFSAFGTTMGIPANCQWGVDTINKGSVLFPHLKALKATPAFIGRYLNEDPPGNLDKADAKYILDKGFRILVIYLVGTGLTGEKKGSAQASQAIQRARGVVPEDCDITFYADIEPNVHVDVDWILGWWKTMYQSNYGGRGGLYVNLDRRNSQHQKQVVTEAALKFPNSSDGPIRLYSQSPFQGEKLPDAINFPWQPDDLDVVPGASVIWQYQTSCVVRGGQAMCDFDLANEDGFHSMWAPTDGIP